MKTQYSKFKVRFLKTKAGMPLNKVPAFVDLNKLRELGLSGVVVTKEK